MTVARRATIAFVVVFLVAVSASVAVLVQADASQRQVTAYRAGAAALDSTMWQIRSDFYNYDDQMNMYVAVLAGGSSKEQLDLAETTYQQAVDARDRLGQDLDHARRLTSDPSIIARIDRLHTDFTGYNGFADQTRSEAKAGHIARAIYLSTVGNLAPSNDMMPTLDKASADVTVSVNQEMDAVESRQQTVKAVSILSAVLLVALILGLAFGMQRTVLRPINGLRASMEDISSGRRDRRERLHVAGDTEFDRAAGAFNALLDTLAAQDEQLQVAQAEREQQLQGDFERQRTAQQEVRDRAQAIVGETATVVAGDLQDVLAAVQVVRGAAGTIDEKVGVSDGVTRAVVEHAREAERVVVELQASLQRVSGMTKLIASVADQTKLLALNATIEAARAGRAGRGFSVVADEVKQLAMTTAQSTGQITSTVASLERDTTSMTTAIRSMTEGLSGMDDATNALRDVARQQFALVETLDGKVIGTIGRVEGMTSIASDLERRKDPRVPMQGSVRIQGPSGVVEASFVDLSAGGLLASCERPSGLSAGVQVQVTFSWQDQSFHEQGRVLDVDTGRSPARVRVAFDHPSSTLRSALRAGH